ncbi:MAG: CdaR family protein [Flavobacteriales bacterium]
MMKLPVINKLHVNSNYRIFFICLLIAGIMWLLINLSKEYRTTVNLIIKYQNPPSGKVLFNEGNDTIQAKIYATGGNILKYKLRNPLVEVNLDEVLLTNNNSNFWLPNRSLNVLREKLDVKEVYRVQEDTIHLIIDELGQKKVPILSKIKVLSNQGFKIINETFSQDSVEIKGPASLVKKITRIPTKEIVFENKEQDFNQEIALDYPPKIKGVQTIDYQVAFEKYTEKTIPIKIIPENVPVNTEIQIIPEEVEIKFTVGYSKFSEIEPQDFQVVCDLNQMNDSSTTIPLKVTKYPKEVENIRIIPSKVKILLIKKES